MYREIVTQLIADKLMDMQVVHDYYDEFVEPFSSSLMDDEEFFISVDGFKEWLSSYAEDDGTYVVNADEAVANARMAKLVAADKEDGLREYMAVNWRPIAVEMFTADNEDARREHVHSLLTCS